MERQSSFGSESSAGSAFSGRSSGSRITAKDAGKVAAEDVQQQEQLKKALFGALYTLAKEKINDSARIAYLTIFVDFILICFLFLMPEYPWAADEHHPIFKLFFYVEFHLPIAHTGYRFYLIVFYILVATLFVSTGICVWVGWCFMNDSFPFLWPIKVARIVVSLFVSMFYIASLNIFLIAMQCQPEIGEDGKRHWVHLIYHLDCMSMPHVIHAAFSLVSSVMFFVVAFLLAVADHELEPMSRSLLAAPHSMTELRMLLCKTVITVADILLRPAPHYQVTLYAASCVLMLWFQLRWASHFSAWINCLRAGLNSILAWISVCLMALTFSVSWAESPDPGSHAHFVWEPWRMRQIWTFLMAGGVPVVFFGGMGVMWLRLHHGWRTALKFVHLEPGVRPRSIHTFFDDFDVEVAARIGRIFDAEGAACDPGALDVAEGVLRAGVAVFPESPYLRIVYSNFLIEVRKNNASGWAQLEMARKLEPNLSYQFSIFTREQEHKQKAAAGSSGEQAVDLVSYVEFQKNYRSLLEYHKAALEATRDFWRLVMREVVPLSSMAAMFARLDLMEGAANRTYKLVLDRYPRNAKLLRSYGRFLEGVKNDPWAAAKYYAEAEKQEELAASAAPEAMLGAEGAETSAALRAAIADRDAAVVTANALGIIQMANRGAQKLLGYKKGELEGKNLSVLMPPPYSTRHNGYMKAFQMTGTGHILDQSVEVVALTKLRQILPVVVTVSRISGSGADATFMGVLKPTPVPHDEVKAWLLPTGVVLGVDQGFTDYTGWSTGDMVGKTLGSISVDPGEVDGLVGQASKCSAEDLRRGVTSGSLNIRHKYGGQVGISLRITLGGSVGQRLLVVWVRRLEETRTMVAVDHKGHLVFANTGMATMLGYKLAVLKSKDFYSLLPSPYNVLHAKWLKEADVLDPRQTPGSCRNGAFVQLLSSNGTPVTVKAAITHHPGSLSQGASWAVAVTRTSEAAAADERRLLLRVKLDGTIVGVSRGTPASLFGHDPAQLVGRRLETLLDVAWEYCKGDRPLGPALTALVMVTHTSPGTSWRVGVGKVQEAEAAAAEAQAEGVRTMMRQASRQGGGKVKAAVMTVSVATRGTDEHTSADGANGGTVGEVEDASASDGAAVVVELWRADLLTALIELGPACAITRADTAAGRLFGVNSATLLQHHLYKYVNLPASASLEDVMGSGAKRGGMKRSGGQAVGTKRQLQGRHADGRQLQLSFQAVIKDGSNLQRLVAVLKPTQPCRGAPRMLEDLVAATERAAAAGGGDADKDGRMERHGSGSSAAFEAPTGNEATADVQGPAHGMKVPVLPLGGLASGGGGGEGEGAATTRRSAAAARGLATARGVELDVEGGTTGRKTRRARFGGGDGDSSGAPERPVELSDEGGSNEDGAARAPHGKQRHATEEEREAAMAAKGSSKARAWLESGFHHALAEDGEEAELPGAIRAPPPGPLAGAADAGEGSVDVEGGEAAGPGGLADGREGMTAATSDITSATGDGGRGGGDYARGKRLRKLMRMLNSYATLRTLDAFQKRMLGMSLGVLLLHIAAFAAILAALANEEAYIHEVEAVGSVSSALHRGCAFARIIEAAQRDYGYTPADMPLYAGLLTEEMDRFETLHQGLYLGFKGLRAIDHPEIRALWHEPTFNVTGDVAGSSGATQLDSLFNIGEMLLASGREVAYWGANRATEPLANSSHWNFLINNGPASAHLGYLRSLNLMARRAQDSVIGLKKLMLAMLVAEGVGIGIGTVAGVLFILRSLMRHRSALFSVFLAVPNTALRTLANKSTAIGDEDEGSDDEEIKATDTEAEAKKKKQRQAQEEDAERTAGAASGEATAKDAPAGLAKSASGRRKVSIFGRGSGGGEINGESKSGRIVPPLDVLLGVDMKERHAMLFGGKRIEISSNDLYRLVWPFLCWAVLVVIMYGTSYMAFDGINISIVAVKLGQRTIVQAGRVAFYAGEVSLAPTGAERAARQGILEDEAALLDKLYWAQLYGGPTMPDSVADGARDESDGALFRSSRHAHILFREAACMRQDTAACAAEGSPWYAITHSGLDPMMRRLVEEASLLAHDNATAITPDASNTRYAYIWSVGAWDMYDGARSLVSVYVSDVISALGRERALHVVLVVVGAVCIGAFLLLLFRPFLAQVRKEGRRVAELLVQLPQDLDLNTLVVALTDVARSAAQLPPPGSGGPAWGAGAPLMGGWSAPGGAFQTPTVPLMAEQGEGGAGRMFSPRDQAGWQQGEYGAPRTSDQPSGMRRRPAAGGRRVAPEELE